MAVATTTQEVLGLADFLAMPETKPAREFSDGNIVQKSMSKGKQGVEAIAYSESLELDLPLGEIYEGVSFDKNSDSLPEK